jgi:hypothetical protein
VRVTAAETLVMQCEVKPRASYEMGHSDLSNGTRALVSLWAALWLGVTEKNH